MYIFGESWNTAYQLKIWLCKPDVFVYIFLSKLTDFVNESHMISLLHEIPLWKTYWSFFSFFEFFTDLDVKQIIIEVSVIWNFPHDCQFKISAVNVIRHNSYCTSECPWKLQKCAADFILKLSLTGYLTSTSPLWSATICWWKPDYRDLAHQIRGAEEHDLFRCLVKNHWKVGVERWSENL